VRVVVGVVVLCWRVFLLRVNSLMIVRRDYHSGEV